MIQIKKHVRNGLGPMVLLAIAVLPALPSAARDSTYVVHKLVSDDRLGEARVIDRFLVNAWGLAHSPTGTWMVADSGTRMATSYDANGKAQPINVRLPSGPTGVVYNGGTGFVITAEDAASAPARFLFATEDGMILGWNPDVSRSDAIVAVNGVDEAGEALAKYTGLAIGTSNREDRLYAADFRGRRVDMFDAGFQRISGVEDSFLDPNLPSGFSPFGIQNQNGLIYVSYALIDDSTGDEVTGAGLGFVNVFTTEGIIVDRIASNGALNAPWGMAIAPDGFGIAGGALLVANFGDGRINAYDLTSHKLIGPLKSEQGPLVIDGLWGIALGNDHAAGPSSTLYFAAGPRDEEHGLFGAITLGATGDQ